MKLYRDTKTKKAKLPKLKYKNIVLTASIILTFLGGNFINVIKDKEVDIPKGVLFYGNSKDGYCEYVNTDRENEITTIKDKLDISDFELQGFITVYLGDYENYYQIKNDPDYKIKDTLSFLENLDEQKDISISLEYDLDITNLYEIMENIPVLKNVTGLKIASTGLSEQFTVNLAQKLNKKFPNLEKLVICTSSIEKGTLESLNNLKILRIETVPYNGQYTNLNINTDFKKLTNLDKLTIVDKEYNIPIYFTLDEYNYLISNGTLVDMSSNIDIYIDICNKLDNIVSELNINEESTVREKINAVCAYVIDNLEYDFDIKRNDYYYEQGNLYPVFKDGFAVCGNYTALTEALFHRLFEAEKSEQVVSPVHAWNEIEVDNTLYYIDTTWLENNTVQMLSTGAFNSTQIVDVSILDALKSDEIFASNWYMQTEQNLMNNDDSGSHIIDDIDREIKLEREEKEALIKRNKERILSIIKSISLLALSVLGMVKLVKDDVKERKQREQYKELSDSEVIRHK